MKTITNKTHRPLRVPLPQGKVLHLGPSQTGEIADSAEDHPPLKAMIDGGEVEVRQGGQHDDPSAAGGAAHSSTQGHPPGKVVHRRGDRGG